MLAQRVALVAASLSLAGCALSSTPLPASLAAAAYSPEIALALDGACAPPDPRIEALAQRIHAVNGREGYYALREMAEVARDRDRMVLLILARNQAIAACMPDDEKRAAHLEASLRLVDAALDGRDPLRWESPVIAVDHRLHPRAMPLASRSCGGHGLEGGLECLFVGVPAGIVDIVSFPLGTWIWAAADDRRDVRLWSFPPGPAVLAEAAQVPALKRW